MNDAPEDQGRSPGTTPARPSVDRNLEGLHPPLDLGDKEALHRMWGEARGPTLLLCPGCHGRQCTRELPWGGHFREGGSS